MQMLLAGGCRYPTGRWRGWKRSVTSGVNVGVRREVMAMSYGNILVETRGRVGVIRLNRPQALNALNSALNAELASAIAAFDADVGIGCMLLTGSEKAFAAGADIKEMADKTATEMFMGD